MARQSHTALTAVGTLKSSYTAGVADLTMTAADASNKEMVAATGNDLIIAHNTGASAHTITVTSVADPYGRTGDLAAYSLGAGKYAVFGPFKLTGWRESDGKVYFEANDAEVKFGVVAL